jgi:cell division protease FtsH
MFLFYSVLSVFSLLFSVNQLLHKSPVKQIYCDAITTPLLDSYEDTLPNHNLEFQDLVHYVNNRNITCATIYTNAEEIIVLDANYNTDYNIHNLHKIYTIQPITTAIMEVLQKNNVPFSISSYRPWTIYDYRYVFRCIFRFYYTLFLIVFAIRLIYYIVLINRLTRFQKMVRNYVKHHRAYSNKYTTKHSENNSNITFRDVAGCDEAKFELTEVVDFLQHPMRYKEAGAKVPSGILLEGPPGTGKTLLAKATAGEAGVSFIAASGSQFVEMYVGVGASRVREIFEEAESKKPCIIFIDEIDAIGQQRAEYGGNSERDQTLNQLLTNMDGFDESDGIIVMAATNRADILDNALTRPGRFDRKVTVGLPDKDGRKQILDVHLRNKSVCEDVDFDMIYELTTGFSGAELANLANEAAILSVRYNSSNITDKCLIDAFEKMTIGLPKEKETRDKESIQLVAYHEGGHTLVALFFQDIFDVRRVTINANNGGAGGYTLFTPKEQYINLPSKRYMLSNIIVALGGRAAEIILYRKKTAKRDHEYQDGVIFEGEIDLDVTAGASNDLKQANSLARKYVSLFGLGKEVGLYDVDVVYGSSKTSENTKSEIDNEVKKLVNYALKCALEILVLNKDGLKKIHKLLVKNTTINNTHLSENVHVKYGPITRELCDT